MIGVTQPPIVSAGHNVSRKVPSTTGKSQRLVPNPDQSSTRNPRQLTALLSRCQTIKQLTQVVRQHSDDFNHINLVTAFSRLAHLALPNRSPEDGSNRPSFPYRQPVQRQSSDESDIAADLQRWVTAVELQEWVNAMVAAPAAEAPPAVGSTSRPLPEQRSNRQHHANISAGSPDLDMSTEAFVQSLSDLLLPLLPLCNTRQLASLTWALAKLGTAPDYTLMQQLVGLIPAALEDTPPCPLDIANLAWGLAKLQQGDDHTFALLSQAATPQLDLFKPQELSNLVWACGTNGYSDMPLLTAVSQTLLSPAPPGSAATDVSITTLKPQELANITWALAKLDHSEPSLYTALAGALVASAQHLKPQELAMAAWGLATAGHRDSLVFTALAGAMRSRLTRSAPRLVVNVLWALATAGVNGSPHVREMLVAVSAKASSLKPQELACVLWAMGKMARGLHGRHGEADAPSEGPGSEYGTAGAKMAQQRGASTSGGSPRAGTRTQPAVAGEPVRRERGLFTTSRLAASQASHQPGNLRAGARLQLHKETDRRAMAEGGSYGEHRSDEEGLGTIAASGARVVEAGSDDPTTTGSPRTSAGMSQPVAQQGWWQERELLGGFLALDTLDSVAMMGPRELSNALWGVASLGHWDHSFLTAATSRAKRLLTSEAGSLGNFKPCELVSVLWALGELRVHDKVLQEALVRRCAALLQTRSTAHGGYVDVAAWGWDIQVGGMPEAGVGGNPRSLWASPSSAHAVNAGQSVPSPLGRPSTARATNAGESVPSLLGNPSTAHATDAGEPASVIDAVEEPCHHFSAADVAGVAHALAVLQHCDEPLMTELAAAAQQLLPTMQPRDMCQLAWSLASLDWYHPGLFSQLLQRLQAVAVQQLPSRSLALVMQALLYLRPRQARLAEIVIASPFGQRCRAAMAARLAQPSMSAPSNSALQHAADSGPWETSSAAAGGAAAESGADMGPADSKVPRRRRGQAGALRRVVHDISATLLAMGATILHDASCHDGLLVPDVAVAAGEDGPVAIEVYGSRHFLRQLPPAPPDTAPAPATPTPDGAADSSAGDAHQHIPLGENWAGISLSRASLLLGIDGWRWNGDPRQLPPKTVVPVEKAGWWLTGERQLRRRLFEDAGWRVVGISSRRWRALDGLEARRGFLRQLLPGCCAEG